MFDVGDLVEIPPDLLDTELDGKASVLGVRWRNGDQTIYEGAFTTERRVVYRQQHNLVGYLRWHRLGLSLQAVIHWNGEDNSRVIHLLE